MIYRMVATKLGKGSLENRLVDRQETIRIATKTVGDTACSGLIRVAGIDEPLETGEKEGMVELTLLRALQEPG